MKPLDDFAQQHPLATGAIGVLSSFLGWLLDNLPAINAVGVAIGTWLGVAVGALTVAILFRKWRHGRTERARHLHDEDEEFDEFP